MVSPSPQNPTDPPSDEAKKAVSRLRRELEHRMREAQLHLRIRQAILESVYKQQRAVLLSEATVRVKARGVVIKDSQSTTLLLHQALKDKLKQSMISELEEELAKAKVGLRRGLVATAAH